jgi:IS5 family transposase
LWDSLRKSLDTIEQLDRHHNLSGWRKRKDWYKKVKRAYRKTSNIHRKKGHNYKARLRQSTKQYLAISGQVSARVKQSRIDLAPYAAIDLLLMALLKQLEYYHEMVDKHIDLVERRIIKGEKIPHQEKVFSIFEPHTEWLQKGKPNNKVELGHNVLVTTDQFHFIVDHKVLEKQTDATQPIELSKRLKDRFGEGYCLDSISFDRGFYSHLSKRSLQKDFKQLVMPKKGKKTAEQEEQEASKTFVALGNKHSAVESNINELEHSGVNRVPDKGLHGFKDYVALGVLAHNLKRLGKMVMEQRLLKTVIRPGKARKAAA